VNRGGSGYAARPRPETPVALVGQPGGTTQAHKNKVALAVLFAAHARRVKIVGMRLGASPARGSLDGVLLLIGILSATATIGAWAVVRYVGGEIAPLIKAVRNPIARRTSRNAFSTMRSTRSSVPIWLWRNCRRTAIQNLAKSRRV
jgi:hypothetical protein